MYTYINVLKNGSAPLPAITQGGECKLWGSHSVYKAPSNRWVKAWYRQWLRLGGRGCHLKNDSKLRIEQPSSRKILFFKCAWHTNKLEILNTIKTKLTRNNQYEIPETLNNYSLNIRDKLGIYKHVEDASYYSKLTKQISVFYNHPSIQSS